MTIRKKILFGSLSFLISQFVQAAPLSADIAKLGKSLTPWGAEISGNADGSIPAYTGGISTPPTGFDPNSGHWIDPYAAEKPLFTIDSTNMEKYADLLSPGVKVLLKRWPTYRLDIYPSHRSYPAMSAKRADASIANAKNPECKTVAEGVGIRGCSGGIPFPLPADGYQAMWNSILHQRANYISRLSNWIVDSSGTATMTNDSISYVFSNYWNDSITPYEGRGKYYYQFLNVTAAPARDAGFRVLIWYPLEFDTEDQRTWSYTTGQRRVRLAPEFSYDTPSPQLSGALNYDEISGFVGRMDRFDFKLVGKKEMFVPYNMFKLGAMPPEVALGKQHVNPDATRWEKHRVWEIEATRKVGKRHIAAKRTFYLDEDSWTLLSTEAQDDGGKIFRVVLLTNKPNYYSGGTDNYSSAGQFYDLSKGQYLVVGFMGDKGYEKMVEKPLPDLMLTPEGMASGGVR